MTAEHRQHRRVPARVEVEVEGSALRVSGFSTNLSLGGVALRVASASGDLSVEAPVTLRLRLPRGEVVEGPATTVWSTSRVVEGTVLRELGVQWSDVSALGALERYLGRFRSQVLVWDWPIPVQFRAAMEPVADVVSVDRKALDERLDAADVGLVVCRVSPLTLEPVLAQTATRATPVLAVTASLDEAWQALLARVPRLICQVEPVDSAALTALVLRVLDTTTQSKQSDRLAVELEREVQALREEKANWRDRLQVAPRIEGLLGTSEAMQQVADAIERLADLDSTVLLVGETGTGKGVAARGLQRAGRRAKKPFIVQNCAALPESLLDSELFGHLRGAFTGAVSDRAGLFEAANGGTIFLDEVTEMSPGMQAKLLTVLQDGELRRVGATESRRVDVRVICASNQPLEALVEAGDFREDLYYRLAPFVVRLPPLRDRREDIALIAAHVLSQFQARYGGPPRTLSPDAIELLEQAPWPGNVRQLQHLLERLAVVSARTGVINAELVRDALNAPTPRSKNAGTVHSSEGLAPGESLDDAVARFERTLVQRALEQTHFVISDAAEKLGVNRSTLSRRLRRLGIRLPTP